MTTPQNKSKIFTLELSYLDEKEPTLELPESHTINFIENFKVNNVKELKQIIIEQIDNNLAENKEWLKDTLEKHNLKLLNPDKTYVQYYKGRYDGMRYAENKDGNLIDLVRVFAHRIKKNEALNYVRTVN